jgi:hypothetical protein
VLGTLPKKWKIIGEVLAEFSQTSTSLWRTRLSGGAPDSVRCPGWPDDDLVALENSPRTPQLKFTRLSGEPMAPATNGRQRNQRATRGLGQRSLGRTGLYGAHRIVSGASRGPRAQRSALLEKEEDRAPDMNCSCPVVHRTIRCTIR